jgi:RNA polymerase sigma-70 factor (ECF subfamily)
MQYQVDRGPNVINVDDQVSEERLLSALRAGDEAVFTELVRTQTPSLIRLARLNLGDLAAAEEVVQETWVGFLDSLERFEGRASVRTWLYRILLNKARTRQSKDARTVPFSSIEDEGLPYEPSVDPGRFRGGDDQWPGHWVSAPPSWSDIPEDRFLASETFRVVDEALRGLPPAQRELVTLRDIDGWSSTEVCNVLGLSETNQRVLLHRGRSRVREALERHLSEEEP